MPRRHDIDALRVIAFALLILYHVGMVYVADWGYHIKSGQLSGALQWPMIALNRWRMPLLFAISGIALGLAMRTRAPGALSRARSWRLLLPLLMGMLAIVPVQAYCEAVANGAVERGFAAFLWRYLQLRPWPGGGWSGAAYGVTWNHLWYLAYAWVYSMLLLAMAPLLQSGTAGRLRAWCLRRARIWWVLVPAGWFLACLRWLHPRFGETHALWGDWYAHATYSAFFLAGWCLAREDGFRDGVTAMRGRLLVVALLAITVELSLRAAGRQLSPDELPAFALRIDWGLVERAARALYAWSAVLAILGWSHAWLNRPFRWLPYASEAVYPWYILHQSLIVLAAYWLVPLGLGPVWEPVLVVCLTVAGCALLHELLIRRVRAVRPLFGLPPATPAGGRPDAAVAATT